MDHVFSICLGLGLAAAAGFRVFVPLLVMSVASYTGHVELGSGFQWVGTLPAVVVFSSATLAEVAAYYVPWLDNLLDAVAAPAAVVAGAVVTASALTDVDPLLKWTLAIIGGGGLAGIVKGTTTLARGASTATTGGLGNPVLSTLELGTSFLLSALAVVIPVITMTAVVILLFFAAKKLSGWLANRQEA